MKSKLLHEAGERTYALVFQKGDEVMAGLEEFAREHGVKAARFTAIGAFDDVTLAYFDRERGDYDPIPLQGQMEVLSFLGDIALEDGAPKVHAHVVVGLRDGSTRGGHLLEGHVWPTLEVVLDESPSHLEKRFDPDTGLALIDPDA